MASTDDVLINDLKRCMYGVPSLADRAPTECVVRGMVPLHLARVQGLPMQRTFKKSNRLPV